MGWGWASEELIAALGRDERVERLSIRRMAERLRVTSDIDSKVREDLDITLKQHPHRPSCPCRRLDILIKAGFEQQTQPPVKAEVDYAVLG